MLTLGVETSCDETSVAVVDERMRILSNVIISQIDIHQQYGGVVPEIASRQHVANIMPVLDEAMRKAQIKITDIQQVAATTRPGLPGAVMVGRVFGDSLATALKVPFVGVNHLHGHIASLKLSNSDLRPPMLCLLISGGHTAVYLLDDTWTTQLLCTTTDDAIGEAFDKVARVLGMPYPGGPKIARMADMTANFTPFITRFPKENFSYSGLKTAVLNYVNHEQQVGHRLNIPQICANFQYCAVEQLLCKIKVLLKEHHVQNLGICGGVAANQYLREQFTNLCDEQGVRLYLPRLELCGDNAAMIAAAALLGIK